MARHSRPAQGLSKDQSSTAHTASSSVQPQPRVSRTRRSVQPVRLVVSDEPPPNTDHPLAGLSPSERQRQRLLKLAEILAEAAKRKAAEQAAKGKEGVQ